MSTVSYRWVFNDIIIIICLDYLLPWIRLKLNMNLNLKHIFDALNPFEIEK